MSDLAVEYVDVDELVPDERNPKEHDLDELGGSVDELGWIEPLVMDERTGKLVSGHGRREMVLRRRAQGDSADPPPGVRIEDDRWLVPVVVGWESRDDDHAEKALVALNRIGERGGWNEEALAGSLERIREATGLSATGFAPDDVDDLMARVFGRDDDPDPGQGKVVELPEDPVTELGDLWIIGRHRVLCGDARDCDNLDRVYADLDIGCVVTDPPYGIGLVTESFNSPTGSERSLGWHRNLRHGPQSRVYEKRVEGDDEPFDASLWRDYFDHVDEQWWFGANYYRRTLSDSDLDGSWLVWDKRPTAATEEGAGIDKVFGSVFELVWSATPHQNRILRHTWFGWTAKDSEHERVHPTEKSAAMIAEILDRWAPDNCLIADPFLGSGVTLLAAHRTGRAAAGIELDPAYVDVAVTRLVAETGHDAIHADTGESFPTG